MFEPVNKYKIKKRWKKRIEKTSRFYNSILWPNDNKCHFNPYLRHNEKNNHHVNFFKIIILFGCIFSIIYFGFYHTFFKISNIKINGLQRIKENEIKDAMSGILDYKKMFIFPQSSYFLADVSDIRDILLQRFPVKTLKVSKIFPNKIIIDIEEKISNVIYDNGEIYSYLDLEGKLVEKIRKVGDYEWEIKKETVTSTNEKGEEFQEEKIIERLHHPDIDIIIKELGELPIIYDKRLKTGEINDSMLENKTIKGIILWYDLLTKNSNIPLRYFILENDLGDVEIKTAEGWNILAKTDIGVEKQFSEMLLVLKEKKNLRPNFNYIDLRYPDRIYWQ